MGVHRRNACRAPRTRACAAPRGDRTRAVRSARAGRSSTETGLRGSGCPAWSLTYARVSERVFFLRRGELESALLGDVPAELGIRAEARWQAYQRQLRADPPQTIEVTEAGQLRGQQRPESTPKPTLLEGLGASAGTYTGLARVIVGEEHFEEVLPGDVLVCPQTSPTWTIPFGRIGALVTDDGGILSHPAIAAREFGLPAVVSTGTATRVLRTGQLLEVDGAGGTVRVLER
jgi:phosphohistidine swiveling domain-containing protein